MADRRRYGDSLLVRLFAVSAVVSVLSIAATAWLVVRSTTRAIQQEQGQAFTDDARIYDAVLGYAATHHDWSAVGPLLSALATDTRRRIALTDRARVPLADTAAGALPARPSAAVDPLNIDENLVRSTADDRIDPRAVGPFRLTAAEREKLQTIAARVVDCLRDPPAEPAPVADPRTSTVVRNADITEEPSGRPTVEAPGSDLSTTVLCLSSRNELAQPTATEQKALQQLSDLVNACLGRRRIPAVTIGLGRTWTWTNPHSALTAQPRSTTVADCLAGARREQLADYVAPAVLLFVSTPDASASTGFDLSADNRIRIFGVASLVLLIAIGATILVGVRVVRPLHALTRAAKRMRDGDGSARVVITGRDEIARLGIAFNDMAERRQNVEELRRSMVSDTAHELRSPVTNIRGWLEAAEEGVVPLDRELMTSLLEEARLLQQVIDDLQDLSAADAGDLRLHLQPIAVPELLQAVAEAFGAAADRASVSLTVDAAPVAVTGDPIRLRQALSNLLTNAIRHTPPGGRITLHAHANAAEIVVDVTDTGPGIPAEHLPLVFERFWRAEKSRNRQTGGSGLGLSIVRKLVEAHGGTATVISSPGEGSTFTIRLPR